MKNEFLSAAYTAQEPLDCEGCGEEIEQFQEFYFYKHPICCNQVVCKKCASEFFESQERYVKVSDLIKFIDDVLDAKVNGKRIYVDIETMAADIKSSITTRLLPSYLYKHIKGDN